MQALIVYKSPQYDSLVNEQRKSSKASHNHEDEKGFLVGSYSTEEEVQSRGIMLLKLALLAVLLEVSMASKLKYKPMSRTEGRSAFAAQFPFRNVSLDWETRVDDLVSRLTVDEVIAQLSHGGAGVNGPAPAIKRLGIGPFQWNSECLRGYAEAGPATSFPDAINLASSFDKSIVYRVAEAGAMEARAKHANYSQYGNFGDHTGKSNIILPVQ